MLGQREGGLSEELSHSLAGHFLSRLAHGHTRWQQQLGERIHRGGVNQVDNFAMREAD
jgi:hypothetical protein